MIKYIRLLFLLFPFALGAQNWSPLNLSDKYNYRLDNDPVITQTIWQTNFSVNGPDTTFAFNTKSCDTCVTIVGGPAVCNTCYLQRDLPRFFGYEMLKLPAGVCHLRNPGGQTLLLFSAVNDSWLFDTTANVTAQVIDAGNYTVLGNMDSVKTLVLSSGDTVRFSKNYGITQWPNGYGQNSYYRLVGIHGRDIGELVPRMTDYFNFSVGDQFEYHYLTSSCWSSATVYDCIRKYAVTSVQVNGNTTVYHVSGHSMTHWTNGQFNVSGTNYGTVNGNIYAINSADHLGNRFNDEIIESENRAMGWWCLDSTYETQNVPVGGDLFAGTRLFKDSLGIDAIAMGYSFDVSYNYMTTSWGWQFIPYAVTDTLYQTLVNGRPANAVVLKKGLGQVAGYFDCNFECYYYEHLEAYRKGNDTVGVFTSDSVLNGIDDEETSSVKVFPNPASDQFQVQLPAAISAEMILTDAQGRALKTFTHQSGEVFISTAALADGLYFLQVVLPGGITTYKMIVHH